MQPFPQELNRQQEIHRQLRPVAAAKQLLSEAAIMPEYFLEIRDVLVEHFECSEEQISPQSRLRQDLRLDEYEVIDFAEQLEANLQIPVPVEEISVCQTIAEVIELLARSGAKV